MKFTTTLLLSLLTIVSFGQTTKDSLLEKDIDLLVEELEFYYGYDQTLREYVIYKSFDKGETNRIENLPDSIQQKIRAERKFRSADLKNKIYREYINPIDHKHTSRLIEITKKYGFPSINRIRKYYSGEFKDSEFSPLLILIHSPKEYWEELEGLMTEEFQAKRINRCQFGYLLWHFNGRNNFKYMLDNGYKWVELENGQKMLKAVDCD